MTNYNGIPNLYTDTITDANGQTLPLMVYLPSDYKIRQYPCFYFFNGAIDSFLDEDLLQGRK